MYERLLGQLPSLARIRIHTLLCAVAPSQQVWTVNCNGGPGVHFVDLPQAVAAASAGDTIKIYYGFQGICIGQSYTAAVIDKPLNIYGFRATPSPTGPIPPLAVLLIGMIEVRNIALGEQVVLSNLSTRGALFSHPPSARGLLVQDCAGSVVLENVQCNAQGWTGLSVDIVNSGNVELRGCQFCNGESPVQITNSTVTLTTTAIFQDYPAPVSPVPPYPSSYQHNVPGLHLIDSTVTMIGSVVEGGNVISPLAPEPGAVVDNSTLRVGPASRLRGGWLGANTFGWAYTSPIPLWSRVEVDPDAILTSAISLLPPPVVTVIPAVYHSWVVAAQPYSVTARGPDNGFAALLFGNLSLTPAPTLWGYLGVSGLRPCDNSGCRLCCFGAGWLPLVELSGATDGGWHATVRVPGTDAIAGARWQLECAKPADGLLAVRRSAIVPSYPQTHRDSPLLQ